MYSSVAQIAKMVYGKRTIVPRPNMTMLIGRTIHEIRISKGKCESSASDLSTKRNGYQIQMVVASVHLLMILQFLDSSIVSRVAGLIQSQMARHGSTKARMGH